MFFTQAPICFLKYSVVVHMRLTFNARFKENNSLINFHTFFLHSLTRIVYLSKGGNCTLKGSATFQKC